MKIRTGFVSNSSTSSFVAIGFLIDDEDYTDDFRNALLAKVTDMEALKEKAKENAERWDMTFENALDEVLADAMYDGFDSDIEIRDHSEKGAPEGKVFIGRDIVDIDENGYVNTTLVTREELENTAAEIGALVGFDPSEVVILGGTEMC